MYMKLLPAKGIHYDDGFIDHVKLLVLGESHHHKDDLGPEHTRIWFERFKNGDRTTFVTNLLRLLRTFRPGASDLELLDSIAFSNLLQKVKPDRLDEPAAAMWEASTAALPEIVEATTPDVVLVTSSRAWWKIYNEWWKKRQRLQRHSLLDISDITWAGAYTRSDGEVALAGFINHPSAPGWQVDKWTPRVNALLNAASELRRR
jgi:hypothetical protein